MKHMLMDTKYKYCSPEIWGGLECTINRVHDQFLDQLRLSGHYDRTDDIASFGELGIKALRFPLLWERHEPTKETVIDWSWAESQLGEITKAKIEPIAGLVHHGSGPSYTSLDSEDFASGLAQYAAKVARQFPWIKYYTPVNEPLTTARFSGLYGIWYPHRKSDEAFVRMLVNQLKAVVLSMQAIREINPEAKLIQTEDLAKIYSTPKLKYQANFENARRWLTNDILCGKLDKNHPLWTYFLARGIKQNELEFFLENICAPDVMGFNHYVTSERFLDHNLSNYPEVLHGGNGRHQYVDTEAVRVQHDNDCGLEVLLKEAWERYGLPIAITEVHLHCTREEQMRWFHQAWTTCNKLSAGGINIKAVTAWSLLGAYGWNRLLTCTDGSYEAGVFDLRSTRPRPTAMAKMIKTLSLTGAYEHPVLKEKGWWQRDIRFQLSRIDVPEAVFSKSRRSRPILIVGKNGTLGRAFARICEQRGISYRLLDRQEMEMSSPEMIEAGILRYSPWAIINAGGFVRVDDAEVEVEKCFLDNATGPHNLAKACYQHDIRFVTYSSDLVFDGKKGQPYTERDLTSPLNVYGESKAKMEDLVLQANPDALIIRTSAFFSPWDDYNFVTIALNTLASGEPFVAVDDVNISPTYVPDLVNASLDLLIDDEASVWHLANEGQTTWADLAREVASRAKLMRVSVIAKPLEFMDFKAPRPEYSVLTSERGIMLPSLESALSRYFEFRSEQPLKVAV